MAAQPKKKSSKARSKKRSINKGYALPMLTRCPKCSDPKISHKVCPSCGYYGQNLVFEPKEKTKVKRVDEEKKK